MSTQSRTATSETSEKSETSTAAEVNAAEREDLVRRIREAAAQVAQSQARLIAVLDRIDREDAWQGWVGIRGFAHWVSYCCEMSAHTAREYIRVMRGLREFPEVATRFAQGRVSYSKVREITRLAGRIDAAEATRMCRFGTAAQLSRMVSTYRRLAPDEEGLPERLAGDVFRVQPLESGRARITIELPEAEAAEILRLVDAAVDRSIAAAHARVRGEAPDDAGGQAVGTTAAQASRAEPASRADMASASGSEEPGSRGEPISRVDQLLGLLRAGSRGGQAGASSRRAEVYVHASLGTVVAAERAGSRSDSDSDESGRISDPGRITDPGSISNPGRITEAPADAAASSVEPGAAGAAEVGYVESYGAVTAATIGRVMCESVLVGALVAESGDVLALGRTRRLASHRQRRALAIRDVGCQFPGCTRTRLLEAHHIRPWSRGGRTDMENMVLVCRSHHIAVHEHDVRITRSGEDYAGAGRATSGFTFTASDVPLLPAEDPEAEVVVFDTAGVAFQDYAAVKHRTQDRVVMEAQATEPNAGTKESDPERICTEGGGEGFDLHECVRWIFDAARLHAADQNTTGHDNADGNDADENDADGNGTGGDGADGHRAESHVPRDPSADAA